jgi:hypothetical protein
MPITKPDLKIPLTGDATYQMNNGYKLQVCVGELDEDDGSFQDYKHWCTFSEVNKILASFIEVIELLGFPIKGDVIYDGIDFYTIHERTIMTDTKTIEYKVIL